MFPALLKKRSDVTNWFDEWDHFFGTSLKGQEGASVHFPRVDIHEDEHNFYIDADLPGIDKENIEIKIENNVLTISGVRDNKREEKKNGYYRLERQSGRFERSFHLGEVADVSQADASFDKGVLTITIPKKEESKPKQLDIKIK